MFQRAFTLIEILITLSILILLGAITLPRWKDFFNHANQQQFQTQFLRAIEFARNEALIRHKPIGICKTDNTKTCSGKWTTGQLVFTDDNEDGRIINPSQILAIMQTHSPQGHLYWRSFPIYRDYLQFSSSGSMSNDNATFWFCYPKNELPIWAIMVNKSGRARSAYPDKNGKINDASGKPLLCN